MPSITGQDLDSIFDPKDKDKSLDSELILRALYPVPKIKMAIVNILNGGVQGMVLEWGNGNAGFKKSVTEICCMAAVRKILTASRATAQIMINAASTKKHIHNYRLIERQILSSMIMATRQGLKYARNAQLKI